MTPFEKQGCWITPLPLIPTNSAHITPQYLLSFEVTAKKSGHLIFFDTCSFIVPFYLLATWL